jgi:SagB-type dehydrogenase family enzyme
MSTLTKIALSMVGHLKPDRAQERSAPAIELPPPEKQGGLTLLEALNRRCSQREFAKTSLPPQILSNLLWAAFGVNRSASGGRTAPSAMNAQEIDVYAALAGGLYLYEPKAHVLRLVAEVDARKVTGYQDFVDEAPLDLIYVADNAHMSPVSANMRTLYSAASAGAISQNVYLYCASAGLATVVRGWFDRNALASALKLSVDEQIVLAQTVGYPGS